MKDRSSQDTHMCSLSHTSIAQPYHTCPVPYHHMASNTLASPHRANLCKLAQSHVVRYCTLRLIHHCHGSLCITHMLGVLVVLVCFASPILVALVVFHPRGPAHACKAGWMGIFIWATAPPQTTTLSFNRHLECALLCSCLAVIAPTSVLSCVCVC